MTFFVAFGLLLIKEKKKNQKLPNTFSECCLSLDRKLILDLMHFGEEIKHNLYFFQFKLFLSLFIKRLITPTNYFFNTVFNH